MTKEDRLRWEFEKLLRFNGKSTDRAEGDSSRYYYQKTRDWWIMFKAGARVQASLVEEGLGPVPPKLPEGDYAKSS